MTKVSIVFYKVCVCACARVYAGHNVNCSFYCGPLSKGLERSALDQLSGPSHLSVCGSIILTRGTRQFNNMLMSGVEIESGSMF